MLHAVWMKVSGLAQEVAAACAREAAEGYVTKVCWCFLTCIAWFLLRLIELWFLKQDFKQILILQEFFIRSDLLCICAIWFQAKALVAAEAGNEPQHEEMETSGQSGNVVRVGPSRISDYSDRPLQTLRKSTSGAGSQNLFAVRIVRLTPRSSKSSALWAPI